MTRKDYILLADVLATFSRDLASTAFESDTAKAILTGERLAAQSIAHRIADQLHQDNTRFDRKRFIEACQLDAERLA
jgi:predicted Zn-dependent peptidase